MALDSSGDAAREEQRKTLPERIKENASTSKPYLDGSKQAAVCARPKVVSKKTWKVGDHCRIVYSGDGLIYEGILVESKQDVEGRELADVRIVGYGYLQSACVDELVPLKGEEARKLQLSICPGGQEGQTGASGNFKLFYLHLSWLFRTFSSYATSGTSSFSVSNI